MKSFKYGRIFSLAIAFLLAAGCGGGDGGGGTSTQASGTGSFVLNADKTELTFEITVDDLSGPITAAHFHNAAVGVDGLVVRTITSSFSNTASGIWKSTDGSEPLTPALVTELEAGRIYVNIHTAANPNGEIRGQLNLVSPGSEGFTARLKGSEEVPPAATSGTGTGAFVLNVAKPELTFDITVDGLSGPITAAHFHNAAAGVNGLVVRTITSSFSSTASGVWKSTDGESFTPALVTELDAGRIYVNIHTAANPDGEIRGQVIANPGTGFVAKLTRGAAVGGGGGGGGY